MSGRAIRLSFAQEKITPGSDVEGTVTVSYQGGFDGIQINSYVIGANGQVSFVSINGRSISIPVRLYVSRMEMMGDKKSSFAFTARLDGGKNLPPGTKIRFRAAIIQQHKEVESDIVMVPVHYSG